MDEFLLLIRSSYPIKQVPLPTHFATLQLLWLEWLAQLKANGSLVILPSHFDETGRILTKDQAVAEGPYVEGEQAIDSLLLIRAADYEAATQIAQGCPILAVGGTVEVRLAL